MSVSILQSDLPALSTSSSTASSSASSISSMNARRIRFAPLPDPRALDDDVDEPNIQDEDPLPIAASTCLPDSKPCSLSSSPSSDVSDLKPTTQQLLSHPPIHHAPSWSRPRTLNLMRPFPFRKSNPDPSSDSSHSLTPTPSLEFNSPTPTNTNATPPVSPFSRMSFSAEEVFTLGTINLFRTSSRSGNPSTPTTPPTPTTPSTPSGWGFNLTRWSSASSYTKSGPPLTRTQSTQSYTPSISSKLKLGFIKQSKPKPHPSSVVLTRSAPPMETKITPSAKRLSLPAQGRKGVRMLNGRVYGGPKRPNRDPNANPFANARDEDPKFVEWGYGGMGSVRGGRHAGVTGDGTNSKRTQWEKLQSDATFMSAGGGAKKGVGDAVDEEVDDGSGMGWVKKRKEQREKEKADKERADKEKAEVATETVPADKPPAPVEPQPEPTPAPEPAPEALSISVPDPADELPPPPVPLPAEAVSAPAPFLEHNLTAVTIPVQLSRRRSYGHRRMASRTSSSDGVPTMPASAPLPNREVSSESETDSDSEKGDEADEDDDEEDDEETTTRRKTALGAGVEKISRHN